MYLCKVQGKQTIFPRLFIVCIPIAILSRRCFLYYLTTRHISSIQCRHLNQRLNHVMLHPVIAVAMQHIVSYGLIHPDETTLGQSLILYVMQDFYAGTPLRIILQHTFQYGHTVVRSGIIHKNIFDVSVSLLHQRTHTSLDVLRYVIYRNNYRNTRMLHFFKDRIALIIYVVAINRV